MQDQLVNDQLPTTGELVVRTKRHAYHRHTKMTTELYTATKATTPGRTLLATTALFLATAALAASMSASRREAPLTERVAPDGWAVTYQVPRRFQATGHSPTPQGPAYYYSSQLPDGSMATLVFLRAPVHNATSAESVASQIARDIVSEEAQADEVHGRSIQSKPLGPFPGAELRIERPPAVIRAAVVAGQDAYVALLVVDGADIPASIYALFETTCASVDRRQ